MEKVDTGSLYVGNEYSLDIGSGNKYTFRIRYKLEFVTETKPPKNLKLVSIKLWSRDQITILP
ncbi:MAG: hypothetical protein LBK70_03130 [Clostridiales bacterium]|nr:hypothetical protein [Clostridiales bacterium]